ncbi:MAG TPA: PilZ domain-containing protein [Tepidisphaeraceae bacterium]|jgi:hypothetical protein
MDTPRQNRLDPIAAARDKRRAPRRSTRDLAIIALGDGDQARARDSFPVQLHDLSAHGARFSGRLPLQRGDHFALFLPLDNQRVTLLATVVHCLKRPDGQTTIGCDFSCVLGPDGSHSIEPAELHRIKQTMLDN